MNRASSGQLSAGLVQRCEAAGAFSFVRHGAFPQADTNSDAWRRVEQLPSWQRPHRPECPLNVLWYHANYVAPSWRNNLTEVRQIGAHIFYAS